MSVLIIFIQKAIVQGICILYGTLGEIMTEKSGNLNLGIPGIMYMGGISGLMAAFLYEKDNRIQTPLSACCSRLSVPLPARRWAV